MIMTHKLKPFGWICFSRKTCQINHKHPLKMFFLQKEIGIEIKTGMDKKIMHDLNIIAGNRDSMVPYCHMENT